jgi:hypothetical protein
MTPTNVHPYPVPIHRPSRDPHKKNNRTFLLHHNVVDSSRITLVSRARIAG